MSKQQQADEKPVIVQFFHPGRECPVGRIPEGESVFVSWNGGGCGKQQKSARDNRTGKCKTICGNHTRRLISHDGTYIDNNGKPQTARLAFWGEWEARTTAVAMPPAKGSGFFARWVHRVESPFEGASKRATNTDPCVFGSTFKYCCCQQHRKGERKPMPMWSLPPGSLVLFGSNLARDFVLDTVFVVGKRLPYEATGDYSSLSVSKEYLEVALNRLRKKESNAFYRGAAFRRSGEMFSFVPARLFEKGDFKCGKRFVLDFRKVNTCLSSSKKLFAVVQGQTQGINPIEAEHAVVRAVWTEIVRQVRAQGFVLGVQFGWPK